jgi:hypothetical protein
MGHAAGWSESTLACSTTRKPVWSAASTAPSTNSSASAKSVTPIGFGFPNYPRTYGCYKQRG